MSMAFPVPRSFPSLATSSCAGFLHRFLILLGERLFCLIDLTHLALHLVLRHHVRVQIRLFIQVLFLLLVLGVCDEEGMSQLHAIVFEPMEL